MNSFAELPEGIWSIAAETPGFTAIEKEMAVGSLFAGAQLRDATVAARQDADRRRGGAALRRRKNMGAADLRDKLTVVQL